MISVAAEESKGLVHPLTVRDAIYTFVHNFFGCSYCRFVFHRSCDSLLYNPHGSYVNVVHFNSTRSVQYLKFSFPSLHEDLKSSLQVLCHRLIGLFSLALRCGPWLVSGITLNMGALNVSSAIAI